jgi:hypothetical protein
VCSNNLYGLVSVIEFPPPPICCCDLLACSLRRDCRCGATVGGEPSFSTTSPYRSGRLFLRTQCFNCYDHADSCWNCSNCFNTNQLNFISAKDTRIGAFCLDILNCLQYSKHLLVAMGLVFTPFVTSTTYQSYYGDQRFEVLIAVKVSLMVL